MRNTIKKLLIVLGISAQMLIGSAGTGAAQGADTWSRYVSPLDLQAVIDARSDIQIIDIRREKDVANGTIPGAVWMPFTTWRGPSERPGQVPTETDLAEMLAENGIRLDQPIVIHNNASKTIQNGRAAIVYWILKSAGADEIAILNGGFTAWQAAALPLAEGHSPRATTFANVSYRYDWWADPMDIFAVTSGQTEGAILDARLDGQVRRAIETGKPLTSMPMAQYIPASFFTRHLTSETMSPTAQAEFRADLEARDIDLDAGFLISVCQTGELSALSWFYASEIVGLDNVLYYPDALRGWESDGGRMFGLAATL